MCSAGRTDWEASERKGDLTLLTVPHKPPGLQWLSLDLSEERGQGSANGEMERFTTHHHCGIHPFCRFPSSVSPPICPVLPHPTHPCPCFCLAWSGGSDENQQQTSSSPSCSSSPKAQNRFVCSIGSHLKQRNWLLLFLQVLLDWKGLLTPRAVWLLH